MTAVSTRCPCCGERVKPSRDLSWDAESGRLTGRGVSIYLPRKQAKLFDFIWSKRDKPVHYDRTQLMVAVYGDDPDGGPESWNIIAVQTTHINKKIAAAGLRIYRGRLIDGQIEARAA